MNKELLRANELKLNYENDTAESFTFILYVGEIVEMLGNENSGGRALFAFLEGKIPVMAGTLWFRGHLYCAGENFNQPLIINIIGKRPALIHSLTVGENMILFSGSRRLMQIIRKKNIMNQANFLLAQVDAGFRAEKKAEDLDAIQMCMLELLRAIYANVSLVCIDNSFSEIGQSGISHIWRILSFLKKRGISVIYRGEGVPKMVSLADRVMIVRNGRVIRECFENDFTMEQFLAWMRGGKIVLAEKGRNKEGGKEVLLLRKLTGPKYLNQFDLRICEGQIVGIYDMNNQANRELASILTGSVKAVSGEIFREGRLFTPDGKFGGWLAYLPWEFQRCSVVAGLSPEENLMLPVMRKTQFLGGILNVRVRNFLREENKCWLPDRHEIEHDGIGSLKKMRMFYEKILLQKPQLLVSEVFNTEADVDFFQMHRNYLMQLSKNGAAIIIVSQQYNDLLKLCDRVEIVNSD